MARRHTNARGLDNNSRSVASPSVGRRSSRRDSDIARVVNEYHAEFDAVIVTGGLGPTHDDETIEAVAAASDGISSRRGRLAWLTNTAGTRARVIRRNERPTGAVPCLPNDEGVAPGCVVENCYVLPGVPGEMSGCSRRSRRVRRRAAYVRTVDAAEPESALLDRLARYRSVPG